MEKFYKKTLQKLEEQINELAIELENPIIFSETVIELVIKRLAELKEFVLQRGFETTEEEIHFFKQLKPTILSKLIYYNAIYRIETKRPYGGTKTIKKYLNNELVKIKRYFDNNLEFYKYYRTNSNHLDHKYFIRGNHDIKLTLDTYYFVSDQSFSTSHDYKVAKIIANDLIQVYLEDQLFSLHKHLSSKNRNTIQLNWTASKTSLIELIYALYSQGVLENGNVDIKLIASSFEAMFNLDLGDYYHTYLELKNRKTSRTKFLDALKESLLRRMEERDEK
jgi:hypothetical protein